MLAVMPTQMVDTGGRTSSIVSYIARPELMTPPGLLMYRLISLSASSRSRKSSWAMITLAIISLMGVPMKTIRSLRSRE